MGRFKQGNQAAKGKTGYRGQGRKTDQAKKALHELLFEADPKGKNLVEKARDTIVKALDAKDEDGNPTHAAVIAAKDVWDRAFGKPRSTMDLKISNESELLRDLDQADKDAGIEEINAIAEGERANDDA